MGARCRTRTVGAALGLAALTLAGCASGAGAHDGSTASGELASATRLTASVTAADRPARRLSEPAHVVVVVLENHSYRQVIDSTQAPYLASLARGGALMTRSYALTHPSQPNYLIMFSGARHGVRDSSCPHSITARNLGRQLRNHGYTFAGYSEDLPQVGWTGCRSGNYVRRHNPWVNFTNLPASVNLPMTAFPNRYDDLPTVSFVIPNLVHDMHDGSVAEADAWIRSNLASYASWARSHDSLLVVTFDEDDSESGNRIPTILYGADVVPGRYHQRITHCSLLRTLEKAYRLPVLRCARHAKVIKHVWS